MLGAPRSVDTMARVIGMRDLEEVAEEMNKPDPVWSLTDDALMLILHAEHVITGNELTGRESAKMRLGQLGGTKADELWRRETAVLRLISTVEAYTEAASKYFFTKKVLPVPKPPFTWPQRIKYYRREHAFDLSGCDGWAQVEAGIDLRNCLAHGLGNLTEILLSEPLLGKRMKVIDVVVGGNRMHPTLETVHKLALGCRRFVLDIESQLVAQF
jgi:hypothetical protein